MRTIWKFRLAITDQQTVKMPKGAQILSAQVQHESVCLWALADSGAEPEERQIEIHGTGNPIGHQRLSFIGTVQTAGGSLVWHVFEALKGGEL